MGLSRHDVQPAPPVEPGRVAEPRPGVEAHEAPALAARDAAVLVTDHEADGVRVHAVQRNLARDIQ